MQNNRPTTHSYQRSRSYQSSFVTSRLTQSVDNPINYDFIYNSWDTLSAGIADKIRSGSVRVEKRYVKHFHQLNQRKETFALVLKLFAMSDPCELFEY